MENQHRKITGYRELSQEEINLMNVIKQQGMPIIAGIENVDGRWLAIGCTDIQTGLMAQPTTF